MPVLRKKLINSLVSFVEVIVFDYLARQNVSYSMSTNLPITKSVMDYILYIPLKFDTKLKYNAYVTHFGHNAIISLN